jgi:hypothetical protein
LFHVDFAAEALQLNPIRRRRDARCRREGAACYFEDAELEGVFKIVQPSH